MSTETILIAGMIIMLILAALSLYIRMQNMAELLYLFLSVLVDKTFNYTYYRNNLIKSKFERREIRVDEYNQEIEKSKKIEKTLNVINAEFTKIAMMATKSNIHPKEVIFKKYPEFRDIYNF